MTPSEEQGDDLEKNPERPDRYCLDISREGTVTASVEDDAEDGTGSQKVERKTKEETYGRSEREYEVNWCEKRGCREKREIETAVATKKKVEE